ncbi:uncharacterized protein N7483_008069 [Penicillium malachiteum]|uniref:uncharacterized protein n=1 Tax=Penicillium malachiteum TaxID=1324776 RepID=UPI002547A9F4|nr:uncharacterized protein N7483_008069 [Penicillium malachiteum]KAJ5726712.1 hypothetical protein N7483_008069 [Penicillium malachiteum]
MTGSSSQFGHATSTPPRKPSTRTVAQRKVYGKKKNIAPRAVFDPKSPIRLSDEHKERDGTVEAIQAKLAAVSLEEKPVSVKQAKTTKPAPKPISSNHRAVQPSSPRPQSTQKSTPRSSPQRLDTPTKPQSPMAFTKSKTYQKMVEVRVWPKETEQDDVSSETNDTTCTSSTNQTPRKKTSVRTSSGFIHDPKANTYVRPILNEALSPSPHKVSKNSQLGPPDPLPSEGSYGEVYKLRLREESNRPAVSKSKLAKLTAYGDGVFKVVPLRAQRGLGSKKFTTIIEIASEVKMLKYLDPIPGFARFREIHVVQGRFPDAFQSAWDYYKETRDDCLNPDPANKKAFPDTQLWAIVEMDDAGCELEKFSWSSVFQIYDIFWGVAMALARAEEYALFEHRDLHLGNVCIRSGRSNGSMDPPSSMEIARRNSPSGFGISALETTIIDYSLSRADLRLADLSDDSDGVVESASSDLDKKQIFDAIGQDEDEILLRDTYRYMRATVYTGNPLETEKTPNVPGIWADYAPRTNLVWLLFILKNLMKNRKEEAAQPISEPEASQRQALAPCSPNRAMEEQSAKSKTDKETLSCTLVKKRHSKDQQARIERLKQRLEGRLERVLDLLDLENGDEDMCCAADLVAYAMDSQWLVEQDFF